jgi:hypothetical protein
MDNLDLVILISIIILFLVLNKTTKVNNIITPIIKKDNVISNKKTDIKEILNQNNNFYKKFITTNINDTELDKLNISKGNITRHTLMEENGGSANYNHLIVNSNISNNLVNYDNSKSTYIKLPYKIK